MKKLLLGLFLLIPFILSAQASDPIALKVMDNVIAKAKENEILKRKYIIYNRHTTIKDLKYNPPPTKTQISLLFGRDNKSYEKLIEENGRKLTNRREELGNFDQLGLYEAMRTRYEYTMPNPQLQLLNDKVVLVVNFKPKDKSQLTFDKNEDEVINRISGTFWIDIDTHAVLKFEAHLTESFTKGLIVFSMDIFNVSIEQEEKFGIMVPKRMTYTVKYRLFLASTYEEQTSTYSDHTDLRLAGQPQ